MKNWVIVSGDFRTAGGMDRANYELARYLAEDDESNVHVVSHFVSPSLSQHPRVTWHRVAKPLNSYVLASPLLNSVGMKVARKLAAPTTRVIANGGNCSWPDINWAHAVHAAWETKIDHAPLLYRLRNSWVKQISQKQEAKSFKVAKLIIANSEKTKKEISDHYQIPSNKIRVVYLGTDPSVFRPFTKLEQLKARTALGIRSDVPVAAFVGSLGFDRNKGFDLLFQAWEILSHDPKWDAQLIVVGNGSELKHWKREGKKKGLDRQVQMLGYREDIATVLAGSDALFSPTHYDAYGLAVHEALCCEIPAFVSSCAGITERFPKSLSILLLKSPPTLNDLIQRLLEWRGRLPYFKNAVSSFGAVLREHTWTKMAKDFVGEITQTDFVPMKQASHST